MPTKNNIERSKNPSKKMTMNQPVDVNQAAAQYQQNIQQGVQPNSGKLASNNMFSLALMN